MTETAERSDLVVIEGLVFAFGERTILSDLNMRFARGKVITIMGSSGSGKATILRLIAGMPTPRSGRITIDGELLDTGNVAHLYALRRKMGMLFQQGALFTDLNAFDNVAFPLREQTDLSEVLIHDPVLMKLQAIGLRNAAQLRPAEISGGMSRRVALARAIALDSALIMYDEPFAGLDPIFKGVIANLMSTLHDTLGSTKIIVSNDVQQSRMADSIYLLSQGQIVGHGTHDEMAASNAPYTEHFIHADADGPVPFQYPGSSLAQDLGLVARPLEPRAEPRESMRWFGR